MNKVVIASENNQLDKIFIGLELEERLQNIENILIKPNLRAAAADKYKECSITNPLIIRLLVEKLLELDKSVTVRGMYLFKIYYQ